MKTKIILLIAGLIILAGIVAALVFLLTQVKLPNDLLQNNLQTPGYYKVLKVVDGDTIAVSMDGNEERVRLIGIDTPETKKPDNPGECYAEQANSFAHQKMEGESVRLEADPINTNRDRYNRLLRYVYLKNGDFINAQIVNGGYGFAYLSFPFTKSSDFANYQEQAKNSALGLWSGLCTITNQNGRYKTNTLP